MGAEPAAFDFRIVEGVLVIRARVNALRGPEAMRLLEIAFDEYEGEKVVVNLSGVRQIESAMIGALTRIGGAKEVRVVGLPDHSTKVLATMGLLNILDRSPTEEEALKAFREGEG
ncbi:MAG: STAS domain-containing protein [Planctomycetales bacterium]|nr:STAS domain-containing protein [Planctomycetales bacterium]